LMRFLKRHAVILILAACVVIAAIASAPTFAGRAVDASLGELDVTVKSFGLVSHLPDFGRSLYRMTVVLTNGGTLPVQYRATGLIVKFTASHTLGANGDDRGALAPGASVELVREFSLLEAVVRDLRAAGTMDVDCQLSLEMTGRWAFWTVDRGVEASFAHRMLFD